MRVQLEGKGYNTLIGENHKHFSFCIQYGGTDNVYYQI